MLEQNSSSKYDSDGSSTKLESKPYRIMICEDELIVATDIQRALEGFGYSVVGITAIGTEAIEMANDFRPDLAIMDIRLHGPMSGIEVAKIIGERYEVPVIYLSAYANSEIVEKAKITEPLAYLVKPFDDVALRTAVEIGVARHRKQLGLKREIEESREILSKQPDESALADRVLSLHKELMEVEKMESLQMMAGGLAHHLNNALAVIQGNIELLRDEDSLTETSAKMAKDAAMASCERVSWIVRQFLWFSDHGSYTVREALVSDIVSETLKDIRKSLNDNIEVIENLPATPLRVMIDKEQVRRALYNILLNAQDAMPNGGAISVSAGEVFEPYPERLNPQAKPGWFVAIRVTDWGTGIKEADFGRIVEPFYTTKALGNGIGLGLTLAYGVAHSHGGWLDFDSKEGHGTIVSMFLPRAGGERVFDGAVSE
jgi:signal transduction histidine kinase